MVLTGRLLEAYTVGTVVTFYDTTVVLEALVITLGLFLGLTLFTFQSKWDFSGMGPFLFGGLWALILAGFVMLFFPHNGYPPTLFFADFEGCGGCVCFDWSGDFLALHHLRYVQYLQYLAP